MDYKVRQRLQRMVEWITKLVRDYKGWQDYKVWWDMPFWRSPCHLVSEAKP